MFGIELVLGPVVDPGVEVARAAGLDAVAADLHVPEQGLAQHLGARSADIGLQCRGNPRGIGRVPEEILLVHRRFELGDRDPRLRRPVARPTKAATATTVPFGGMIVLPVLL